jgi:site-specific DNA-methyltransferase (adenine-specific)
MEETQTDTVQEQETLVQSPQLEIVIKCQGATTVRLDELNDLHHFKHLSDTDYAKGRAVLLERGFKFPFSIWVDPQGKKWTVDGHQRRQLFDRMKKEGIKIPEEFPADYIYAENKADAARDIIASESKFGDIVESDFTDFLHEYDIDFGEVEEWANIPSIEDNFWQAGDAGVTEDEPPPVNENEPAVSQLGEVYQLGRHRLMCGDSTKIEDIEKLMNGQKADMVFTDPPYGVSYADKNAALNIAEKGNRIQSPIEGDHKTVDEMYQMWLSAFSNMNVISKDGFSYYVCSPQGGELMMMMMMALKESGVQVKHTIIWVKNNIVLGRSDYHYKHEPILYGWGKGPHQFYGGRTKNSVWNFDKPLKSDLHPTMKPIALIAEAINNSSKSDDIILDLFGGSGSALIACEQTNRVCYCSEIDNKYVDVIIKRWMKFAGKRAYKIIDAEGNQCNIPVKFADESFMESKTLQEDSEVKDGSIKNTVQNNAGQSEQQ